MKLGRMALTENQGNTLNAKGRRKARERTVPTREQ